MNMIAERSPTRAILPAKLGYSHFSAKKQRAKKTQVASTQIKPGKIVPDVRSLLW
jgi:hypothetical protein